MTAPSPNGKNVAAELRGLARLFGKLGFVTFGGPAAPVPVPMSTIFGPGVFAPGSLFTQVPRETV